ncbi:MAG: hypothetical protein HETSPECPRED_006305 [Heterodermia speciosa]|uniref:Rhodopsin domain-containing protein n=1 Tax=Heterodermia speciosa TaxID=116794 RepID=A0A8H3FM48_9LECA|nr:MAG: hypothetical protein HETSPECPRED_006305 [Heterodermia speciosa]
MPSSQLPTPAENPALWANRNSEVMSASVTFLVLPTFFVALRLLSRYMSGAGLWWDDWTAILGMVLSWGCNITNILGMKRRTWTWRDTKVSSAASHSSLGHHTKVLPLAVLIDFYRHVYAFQVQYSLAMTLLKISVVSFQYRIFPVVPFRRIVLACGAFVLAFGTASTLAFILACTPLSDFWLSLSGGLKSELRGNCISIRKLLLINGGINTFTDIALLLLPLPILWRLRASRLQKLVLTGIFITGLVVVAVSMVRLVLLARYRGHDITWDFLPASIWTAAEPSIAVVCACLPSLRPLFVRLFRIAPHPHHPSSSYFSDSNKLASEWRNGSTTTTHHQHHHDRSFNRLPDGGGGGLAVPVHGVKIYGGKGGVEVLELGEEGGEGGEGEGEGETPVNRIRAKTTVVWTVSERVDWRDDLF